MQVSLRVLSEKNLTHAGGPTRSFEEEISPLQTGGAHFRGRYFTHARGRIQSFGKKFHACRWVCAFFWEENAPMRDGWRALSGMIWPFLRGGGRMCPRFLGFCNRPCRPFLRSALKQTAFRIRERGRRLGVPLSACQKTCCQIAICINAEFIYTATGSPARVLREKRPVGTFSHPRLRLF